MKKIYFFIFLLSFTNFLFLGLSGSQIVNNNNSIKSHKIESNVGFDKLNLNSLTKDKLKVNHFEVVEATDTNFNNLKLKLNKLSLVNFSNILVFKTLKITVLKPAISNLCRYLKLQVLRI